MSVVAVTGASGHVGANLVRALLERGDSVRVLVHHSPGPGLAGLDVERRHGDVRDPAAVRAFLRGADELYHCAAVISIVGGMGGLVEDVNVRGPAVVAEAALHAGVRRMVHFASVHAFQQAPLDEPLDESRARVVHGLAYDRSKASGEAEVRLRISQGLDAVIVHPSGVIGPYDFAPSRMGKVFLDLYRGRLPALVPGGFDWVDARDVVAGAIAAMERGIRGRSYLLSGHYAGIPELSAIAAGLTGRPAPRLQVPLWLAKVGAPFMQLGAQLLGVEPLYTLESLHALQANRVYVRTRAAQDLGHAPRPLHESVRDTYRWFAQAGRLPRDLLERLG